MRTIEFSKLTDREQYLMKSIWELGDGTRLAYMVERVNEKYGLNWKPQTASTFLNKLVLKGYVSPYREGQYIHYAITISEEEYLAQVIREDVDFWYDGDTAAYANAFIHCRKFSKEELAAIKAHVKAAIDEKS